MSDVFISYSRRNSDFARRLIGRLTRTGKDAWVDWEGIPLTAPNWWSEIKSGIEAADSFVFIMTPDSMASVVCNLELDYAIELNKRIIPIAHVDIETRDAFASIADYKPDDAMQQRLQGKDPLLIARNNWQHLSHINWIFFRESDDFDAGFAQLIETVDTNLDYVKAHTRYLTRATEWQRENQRADLLLFGEEIDRAETWLSQAKTYATQKDADKTAVVNPLAQPLHREYIQASRAADRRRRRLVRSAQISIAVLIIVLVTGALIGSSIVAQTQREVDAANTRLTAIPPTLTHAAVIVDEANIQREIASGFAQSALAVSENQRGSAMNNMDALIQQYPDHAIAYNGRGLIHALNGNYDAAIVDYTEAIRLQPAFTEAFYNRGLAHIGTGAYTDAVRDFDRAIQLNPADPLPYNNRGYAAYNMGDFDAAIVDFNRAIERDPTLALAYYNRGVAYGEMGDYEAALADFDETLRLDPQYRGAHANRGLTHFQLGDVDAALDDFTAGLALNPRDASIYNARGFVRNSTGEYEAALSDLNEAIRLNPELAEAYHNRGVAHHNLGNYQAALADYDAALALDSFQPEVYYDRGITHATLGDFQAAINDYDKAIQLDPTPAAVYNNRGFAYFNLNDFDRALTDYDLAIQLDANFALAYLNRGNLYASQGDFTAAIADYDEAIRLQPDDPRGYHWRGFARIVQRNFDDAIADLNTAIRFNPDYAEAYVNRGFAHYFRAEVTDEPEADQRQALSDWETAESLGITLPPHIVQMQEELQSALDD